MSAVRRCIAVAAMLASLESRMAHADVIPPGGSRDEPCTLEGMQTSFAGQECAVCQGSVFADRQDEPGSCPLNFNQQYPNVCRTRGTTTFSLVGCRPSGNAPTLPSNPGASPNPAPPAPVAESSHCQATGSSSSFAAILVGCSALWLNRRRRR